MSKLSFDIISSPSTNDHQVRVIIDDYDLLGKEHLGVDPPMFFAQENSFIRGELLIGRCTCGVVGCSDYSVSTNVNGKIVTWTNSQGLNLVFDRSEYEETILHSKSDFSWEDKTRRAERLVEEVIKKKQIPNDYKFDWASARIKNSFITLSFSRNAEQKLLEFKWDRDNLEAVQQVAEEFILDL